MLWIPTIKYYQYYEYFGNICALAEILNNVEPHLRQNNFYHENNLNQMFFSFFKFTLSESMFCFIWVNLSIEACQFSIKMCLYYLLCLCSSSSKILCCWLVEFWRSTLFIMIMITNVLFNFTNFCVLICFFNQATNIRYFIFTCN